MTEIFPGSLPYAGKTLHNVVMCCAICFIWTFLGLTEKPHSYYVGNIKGCAATRAEVESVGGLWHTPDFSPSAHRKHACTVLVCVWVQLVCMSVWLAEGSHAVSNEVVWLFCSGLPPNFNEASSHPQPNTSLGKSSNGQHIPVVLYRWRVWYIFYIFKYLDIVKANCAKLNQIWIILCVSLLQND